MHTPGCRRTDDCLLLFVVNKLEFSDKLEGLSEGAGKSVRVHVNVSVGWELRAIKGTSYIWNEVFMLRGPLGRGLYASYGINRKKV